MVAGGIFFWICGTVQILGNYLGGACLLPLICLSFLNYCSRNTWLMRGGFQDAYIAMAVSRLNSRNGQENHPQLHSKIYPDSKQLSGIRDRICHVCRHCCGIRSQWGIIRHSSPVHLRRFTRNYNDTSETLQQYFRHWDNAADWKYLLYASIANVIAVVLAAFFGALTKLIPALTETVRYSARECKSIWMPRNVRQQAQTIKR